MKQGALPWLEVYLDRVALIEFSSVDNDDTPIAIVRCSSWIEGRGKVSRIFLAISVSSITLDSFLNSSNLISQKWKPLEKERRRRRGRISDRNETNTHHPCRQTIFWERIIKDVEYRNVRRILHLITPSSVSLIIRLERSITRCSMRYWTRRWRYREDSSTKQRSECSCERSRTATTIAKKNLFCHDHFACFSVGNLIHICSIAFFLRISFSFSFIRNGFFSLFPCWFPWTINRISDSLG